MKECKMFGQNVAEKYVPAVTKNLGLGQFSAAHFLITHPSSVARLNPYVF